MLKILKMPPRAYTALFHDAAAAGLSFLISLYICLGENFIDLLQKDLLIDTLLFMLVSTIGFLGIGLYKGLWRYASLNEVAAIFWACAFAIPAYVCLLFFTNRLGFYPRLSFLANGFVLIALLSGPRFIYRLLQDQNIFDRSQKQNRIPVLLIGAGDSAELFIREMIRSKNAPYRVIGLLDTNNTHVGFHIRGIKVWGTINDFEKAIQALTTAHKRPQHIIIADEKLRGSSLRPLVQKAEQLGLPVSRVPKITDLQSGVSSKKNIRPIAIEDLLGRPQNVLDRSKLDAFIKGRRVLVTGAGGSIGGELVRQICAYEPSHIILLDNSEFLLYTIDLEVKEKFPNLSRSSVLADVRDYARLKDIFYTEKPDLVFHAAAVKHVPIVEDHPLEAILTNVIGSKHVADLCRDFHVRAMVMISTDKAVNPSSIMGTTKRLAEAYCQALDREISKTGHKTRYVTVRFGNVLGSNGSVVPLFQRQLAAGGPITITHPDVIRYFMTIREAVELVLQAAILGTSNKADIGKIFVLDMGEPVRILDLANQMILLAGLQPNEDVKIEITGLRPGEKLYEELFHGSEEVVQTQTEGIMLAAPRSADYAIIKRALQELEEKCAAQDADKALAILHHMVPEYRGDQVEGKKITA